MKRKGNIYHQICSLENLYWADQRARKGKADQYGVQKFDKDKDANLLALQKSLQDKTYRTSQYSIFKIFEPKEREIYSLPYFPDRVTHHAVMNVLEPVFVAMFTADTYSCIKGRGIHLAAENLKKALKDRKSTRFCLKLDIKKFYPSVNHEVLKQQLRRKFKDPDLLWLLDEIIDSAPGLPIGNLLSQYLSNFYLTPFDRWLKEELRVKNCFRYADDIVILGSTKQELHYILEQIKAYLQNNLKLSVKENYQVFPVQERGIDFLGYVFRHSHTLIRKSIKQRFAKAMKNGGKPATLAAYWGWFKHCDSRNLMKKLTGKTT